MKRFACVLIGLTGALCQTSAWGQTCAWRPWAANWSTLNKGDDLAPPNLVYNPTNWDYSLSQETVLNMFRDAAPGGGTNALHFFLDSQPPATTSNGQGSGGFYQEITVTPGSVIQYSFYWKGKFTSNTTWYEFLLIDGPFSPYAADSGGPDVGPSIKRKRSFTSAGSFGWEQLTDQSTEYIGAGGATLTPTGTIVAVVLKAGHGGDGGAEAFFDSVVVYQNDGPNLLVNGDVEDEVSRPDCDNQLMKQDSANSNYWFALTQCPGDQHTTVAPVAPATHDNAGDTTMTITGTYLELVEVAKLVPVAGGAEIAGVFTPPAGPNATSMTVVFPTTNKTDGTYDLVTTQAASPPCLVQVLPAAFELTCSAPIVVSDVSPAEVTDPAGSVQVTVAGTGLSLAASASLAYSSGEGPNFIAPAVVMDGDNLLASFDLSCAPAGLYDLVLTRSDSCRPATVSTAVRVVKTPLPGGCLWQPWAASWTHLNLGADLDEPNNVFDATNWDYTFSQHPNLGTALDTPDGSNLALHWFLDGQAGYGDNGIGSGGVFQQIAVQAGLPLAYSFQWKGAGNAGANWFEFLLIDGPFSMLYADVIQESAAANNPAIIRKRSMGAGSFDWAQLTDQSPADTGPAGPRPQTITPTGTVVTVVLKAGRSPDGSMESLWDNIVVTQSGGPNLIANGDFESGSQAGTCDREAVEQVACELNAWRRSSFAVLHCSEPFADADGDLDVDQADFALFQACFTGSGSFALSTDCACFDRPEPIDPDGDVDQTDLLKFESCATGPGIAAIASCDD